MAAFTFGFTFGEAYYDGGLTLSEDVSSHLFDVALGGHRYMIDWNAEVPLRYAPVPFTRAQSDDTKQPGEQTINPEGFWRRTGESWHLGAGQEYYDREDSVFTRFRSSKGADVWTRFQWSLLNDTDQKDSSANTNLRLAVAGSRLYYTDGATLSHISDVLPNTPTQTAVTGHPVIASSSITSDGFNVWTAHGTSGIYKTTRTTAAMASHITGTVAHVAYVRNRVIAANAGSIYDVTALAKGGAPGALPAALYTHANTDFQWVDFAEMNGFIYAAGYSGDKSLIYRFAITDDATALTAPTVAGQLPDGEIVTHLNGYLGNFLFIGSEQGWRLGVATGTNGDLRLGQQVLTPDPVLASEPQDEFIWYGLGRYDSTSSGLGRLSTGTFTDLDNIVPAYASDLMVAGQSNVQSIVTFQGVRVFTLSQLGLYAEDPTRLVAEGTIDTGLISYNMTEAKVGIWFDIQYSYGNYGYEVFASYDGSPFVPIGSHVSGAGIEETSSATMFLGAVRAATTEFRLKLTRDGTNPLLAHMFKSWLFRVQPTAEPTDYIYATILLADVIENLDGQDVILDTYAELDFLAMVRRARSLLRWEQQEVRSNNVFLEDIDLIYHSLASGMEGKVGYNGSALLKMKVVN